jgi:hypothetical protein
MCGAAARSTAPGLQFKKPLVVCPNIFKKLCLTRHKGHPNLRTKVHRKGGQVRQDGPHTPIGLVRLILLWEKVGPHNAQHQ